jgi:hypothetical protein
MNLITFAIALLLLPVAPSDKIPVGTVIPVMLSSSLNAAKDKSDTKLEGKVMQEIVLPSGVKIRQGARIFGHTVNVSTNSSGSRIVVKFTSIQNEGRSIRVTTGLLALASMAFVSDAQLPVSSSSDATPNTQWVTRQIGGDLVRRGVGTVYSSSGLLGRWVGGSSVLMKLTPNVNAGCSGGPGYDDVQAVWVFSSSACGTYGLSNVKIASSGLTKPIGDISLSSNGNINIRGGSGWLLIVAGESGEQDE